MSVEVALISQLIKLLRDDPAAHQLEILNKRVARLAYGFCIDGSSALEDALNQTKPQERERYVLLALEYFRQGYSRNEPPWTSLCAKAFPSVTVQSENPRCQALHQSGAWDQCESDRELEGKRIFEASRDTPRNILASYKTRFFNAKGIQITSKVYLNRARLRFTSVYELSDTSAPTAEMWQNVFVLERQARRLIKESVETGAKLSPSEGTFTFPVNAYQPVFIYVSDLPTIAYKTADGEVHRCTSSYRPPKT